MTKAYIEREILDKRRKEREKEREGSLEDFNVKT